MLWKLSDSIFVRDIEQLLTFKAVDVHKDLWKVEQLAGLHIQPAHIAQRPD